MNKICHHVDLLLMKTPNTPDGLFERIEKEADDTCIYKRLLIDYTFGVGKIYAVEKK